MKFSSIKEKCAAIKNKELSAQDNISYFLNQIKEKEHLNAFIVINENALEEAKKVDGKIVQGIAGKLAGLAIAVKSAICVKGLETNCASKTLEGWISPYDADAIAKIKAEDGIIIGMTNMDEFASGASGELSAFGATKNPVVISKISGGSSSGSAVAAAADLCDMSLGTDTGGSIRNPASHCGVVGIKPSYGRVSRFGLIDLSMSLDQIGPLSKDVFGAALLLEVISGKSHQDPTTFDKEVLPYTTAKPFENKRIGIVTEFADVCAEKRIYNHVMDQIKTFAEKNNCSLVEISLPHVDLGIQSYYPLVYTEFYSGTRKFDGRKFGKRIEESCGPEVLRRVLGGKIISQAEFKGAYYRKALHVKNIIKNSFDNAFQNVDVIMSPTVPLFPHNRGEEVIDTRVMYAYDSLTIPANLAGICAGVVPGERLDGIPLGIQVMTPAFKELLLFSVLQSFETFHKNKA